MLCSFCSKETFNYCNVLWEVSLHRLTNNLGWQLSRWDNHQENCEKSLEDPEPFSLTTKHWARSTGFLTAVFHTGLCTSILVFCTVLAGYWHGTWHTETICPFPRYLCLYILEFPILFQDAFRNTQWNSQDLLVDFCFMSSAFCLINVHLLLIVPQPLLTNYYGFFYRRKRIITIPILHLVIM
jgi:hypothetical protein